MSLNEFRMESLRDRQEVQAEAEKLAAEKLREEMEKDDRKQAKIIKKSAKKK